MTQTASPATDTARGCNQGQRPLAAIGRDRAVDQARVGRRDRGIVEPVLLHHAAGEILHNDIRFRDQFAGDFERRSIVEIERDAALVAIQADKGGTLAGEIGMFITARVIAAIRVREELIDLDVR